jgi:signal transduction histidine kinase
MKRPLRRQLLAPLATVTLLSAGLLALLNAWYADWAWRSSRERQVQGVVDVLTSSNFPLSASVLQKMARLSRCEFAVTDRAGGTIQAASLEMGNEPPFSGAVAQARTPAGAGQLVALPRTEIEGRAYFHAVVDLPGRPPAPPERLHVLLPVDDYQRARRSAVAPPLLLGAATFIALALTGLRTAGRFADAVAQLGAEVRRLATGDYREIALPRRDDELRALGAAINQTATQLAAYERQVRATERSQALSLLGASLAHELRNSATGCRMALDLHAERCPAADSESLTVARRQLTLMEKQLQRFFAAAGGAERAPEFRVVDVRSVLQEVVELTAPHARHAGVALVCELPETPVDVDLDRDAVVQAVLNLTLNAVDAARRRWGSAGPPRASLELATTDAGAARVTVRDNGAGPPADLAAQIFDAFVSDKPEGAGLGLAIVRRTAQLHGGSVDWRRVGELTEFTLTIPLDRSSSCDGPSVDR